MKINILKPKVQTALGSLPTPPSPNVLTDVSVFRQDLQLRPVFKSQIATFEVDGGFSRRPAPCDGVIVETTHSTILVPLPHLIRVLRDSFPPTKLRRSRRKAKPCKTR